MFGVLVSASYAATLVLIFETGLFGVLVSADYAGTLVLIVSLRSVYLVFLCLQTTLVRWVLSCF